MFVYESSFWICKKSECVEKSGLWISVVWICVYCAVRHKCLFLLCHTDGELFISSSSWCALFAIHQTKSQNKQINFAEGWVFPMSVYQNIIFSILFPFSKSVSNVFYTNNSASNMYCHNDIIKISLYKFITSIIQKTFRVCFVVATECPYCGKATKNMARHLNTHKLNSVEKSKTLSHLRIQVSILYTENMLQWKSHWRTTGANHKKKDRICQTTKICGNDVTTRGCQARENQITHAEGWYHPLVFSVFELSLHSNWWRSTW